MYCSKILLGEIVCSVLKETQFSMTVLLENKYTHIILYISCTILTAQGRNVESKTKILKIILLLKRFLIQMIIKKYHLPQLVCHALTVQGSLP